MKTLNLILVSGFSLLAFSCKKQNTETTKKTDSLVVKKDSLVPEIHKEMYGIYNGTFSGTKKVNDENGEWDDFEEKRISLKINRITKDSVYGHSIVNGNQRPFRGILNESENSFVLDEPGNDKTDGRFEVKIKGDSLTGKWNAYTKSAVKFPDKQLKLIKKSFVYNPNFMLDENSDLVDWWNPKEFKEKYTDEETGKTENYTSEKQRFASDAVFKINASKQQLSEKDIKNLRKLDLEIIKNAVFARHGYSFKKETYRYFFEQTDWYVPVSGNVDNDLTKVEKQNVDLLNRFIKYAEDKYDQFGR